VAPVDELVRILGRRVIPPERMETTACLASRLAEAAGPSLLSAIFFGSHLSGASPAPESAYDFFLIVSGYGEFYRALRRKGLFSRPAGPAALANVFLPPNLISTAFAVEGRRVLVKGAVVSARVFARETGKGRHDHFQTARLFQHSAIAYSRSPAIERFVLAALARTALGTWAWAKPRLPEAFGLEDYLRTLFRISLEAEIKPEGPERGEALFLSQRTALEPVYALVLDEAAAAGEIRRLGTDRYGLIRPATLREHRESRRFFARSKMRATARWVKHRWTFEGSRDYIARKFERRGDPRILAIIRERKVPLIFLWPRIARELRLRRRRDGGSGPQGGSACPP